MDDAPTVHFSLPAKYHAAVAEERAARDEAYLETGSEIQGIPVVQITPRILARLFHVRTPFIGKGEITEARIAQFLWIVAEAYAPSISRRDGFVSQIVKSAKKGRFDFVAACQQIDEFCDLTFMDAPGGKAGMSYVSSIAWIEYRMSQEPFKWDFDTKTADIPLRRIYQLLRCDKLDKQETVDNRKSEAIRQVFLNEVTAEVQAGMESGRWGWQKAGPSGGAATVAQIISQGRN